MSFVAKRWLKTAATAAGSRWVRRPTRRVVVLCYHSVHPSKGFASATPATFTAHIDWLAEHCRLVPLRDVPRWAAGTDPVERPVVAITFDDGYMDNYEHAFPLLADRGVPSTVFVTAGLLEHDPDVVERMKMLRESGYDAVQPLEWWQARAMRAGGVEIGAHTYSHPNLATLGRAAARAELARSKEILEQRLGEPVSSMAYPFGKPGRHFTAETVALVEELGYEYACAVLFRGARRSDSRFRIPRFFVRHDSIEELRAKVLGAWDPIGVWQEKGPLWLARRVSPRDFAE